MSSDAPCHKLIWRFQPRPNIYLEYDKNAKDSAEIEARREDIGRFIDEYFRAPPGTQGPLREELQYWFGTKTILRVVFLPDFDKETDLRK